MKNWCIKTYAGLKGLVNNERGAQAIEWIALAGIVVLIFAAISQFVSTQDGSTLGQALIDKLEEFIKQIG